MTEKAPTPIRDELVELLRECGCRPVEGIQTVIDQLIQEAQSTQDFDRNPAALEWARTKILDHVEKASKFAQQAADKGYANKSREWSRRSMYMRQTLIGGNGCVIAAFDERLPELRELQDRAKK